MPGGAKAIGVPIRMRPALAQIARKSMRSASDVLNHAKSKMLFAQCFQNRVNVAFDLHFGENLFDFTLR